MAYGYIFGRLLQFTYLLVLCHDILKEMRSVALGKKPGLGNNTVLTYGRVWPERKEETFCHKLSGQFGFAREAVNYPWPGGPELSVKVGEEPVTPHAVYDKRLTGFFGKGGMQDEYFGLILGCSSAFFVESGFSDCYNASVMCKVLESGDY